MHFPVLASKFFLKKAFLYFFKKNFVIFQEIELSSPKIKKFQEGTCLAGKIEKTHLEKKYLKTLSFSIKKSYFKKELAKSEK